MVKNSRKSPRVQPKDGDQKCRHSNILTVLTSSLSSKTFSKTVCSTFCVGGIFSFLFEASMDKEVATALQEPVEMVKRRAGRESDCMDQ